MQRADVEKLRRSRSTIGKQLIVNDDFINVLYQDHILTDSMIDELNAIPEAQRSKRASFILLLLPRRGPTAFRCFVNALVETDQEHIASVLDGQVRRKSEGNAGCAHRKPPLLRTISQPSDADQHQDGACLPSASRVESGPCKPTPFESQHAKSAPADVCLPSASRVESAFESQHAQSAPTAYDQGTVVSKPEDEGESISFSEKLPKIPDFDISANIINIDFQISSMPGSNMTQTSKVYKNVSRGYAVIINVGGAGSIFDELNMEQLLTGLQYTVKTISADPSQDFRGMVLKSIGNEESSKWDSFFLVIFTHSFQEKVDMVYKIFDEQKCLNLVGKPKFIFIYELKTVKTHNPMPKSGDTPDTSKVDDMSTGKETALASCMQSMSISDLSPPHSDMLLALMVSDKSDSEDETCNPLVHATCQVFLYRAFCLPVPDMLREIEELIECSSCIDHKSTSIVVTHSLKEKLILYPFKPDAGRVKFGLYEETEEFTGNKEGTHTSDDVCKLNTDRETNLEEIQRDVKTGSFGETENLTGNKGCQPSASTENSCKQNTEEVNLDECPSLQPYQTTFISIEVEKAKKNSKVYGGQGSCILINIGGAGSQFDEINIEQLLQALQYSVVSRQTDSSQELHCILKKETEKESVGSCRSFFVVILYNSLKNGLNIQEICDAFAEDRCPQLAGKVKIVFIFDIKVGKDVPDAIKADSGASDGRTNKAMHSSSVVEVSPVTDMLLAYLSSTGGSEHICNKLVVAVIQVFMKCAHYMSVQDMLNEIKSQPEYDSSQTSIDVMDSLKKPMNFTVPFL